MERIKVDMIASTALLCELDHNPYFSPYVVAEEGYAVVVRALQDKDVYNQLETIDGTFHTLRKGVTFVGVLGERQALKGYSGRLPLRVDKGDIINVLNMGGILGKCISDHPELGPALKVEVLGAVMVERDGQFVHARIKDRALQPLATLEDSAPLFVISGTAMDTGKTLAGCKIIEGLAKRGYRVCAGKLTGASLRRDVRNMQDHGAIACVTFTDGGIVASTNKRMAPVAKAMIKHLNTFDPDVIVLEMGDGFIGYYGVDELLLDKELQSFTTAHVVTAADLAGVWAADEVFRNRYKAEIAVITGPVTDNEVGNRYIEQVLGIRSANAISEPDRLAELVAQHSLPKPRPVLSKGVKEIAI